MAVNLKLVCFEHLYLLQQLSTYYVVCFEMCCPLFFEGIVSTLSVAVQVYEWTTQSHRLGAK